MKNRDFDCMLRQRAANENMELSAEAQEHFRDALDAARIDQARQNSAPRRKKGWIAAVIAAECMLALALVLMLMPARDVTDQGFLPQETQESISATMEPVTQPQRAQAPEVTFEASAVNGEASLYVSFCSQADDIWLVEWSAQLEGGDGKASGLIWLEPGAECSEHIAWLDAGQEANITAGYRGYRVAAKVLHWMDGEYLQPGDEGYHDQQALIEDAFAAGALILAPGDWANGQAGPMQLVLPERYARQHPQTTGAAYYLAQGLLEDGGALCSGEEHMSLVSLEEQP